MSVSFVVARVYPTMDSIQPRDIGSRIPLKSIPLMRDGSEQGVSTALCFLH
jgi:hypothetical protein